MSTDTQIITIPDLRIMADAIARSGLFGMKTGEQALSLMLIAQAEGRHPATAAQDYDIIQGRPAIKAERALARFQASGGSIKWLQLTNEVAEAEFSHPQGGTHIVKWTMDDAKLAGLTNKDNWKKYPRQMLKARVSGEGPRIVYPACLSGLMIVEEARDMEEKDMGEAERVEPEKPIQPCLESFTDEEFAVRFDEHKQDWLETVKKRGTPVDKFILRLERRFDFTEAQRKQIEDFLNARLEQDVVEFTDSNDEIDTFYAEGSQP